MLRERYYTGQRRGLWHEVHVVVPNISRDALDPRFDLWNHSPTGFGWGYLGSGPAQLALALLADALENDGLACLFYQSFKDEVVAALKDDAWRLDRVAILDWTVEHMAELLNEAISLRLGVDDGR